MKYATSDFAKWLEAKPQCKSPKTARSYVNSVNTCQKHIDRIIRDGMFFYHKSEAWLEAEWPLEESNPEQLKLAISILKDDAQFTELNSRGNYMYSAGLSQYLKYTINQSEGTKS
jgi:hypothetical protein